MCAEVGPRDVQHSEIAKRLGIKPPSLYAHYTSIDEILAATYKRSLEELLETYRQNNEQISAIEALNQSSSRQVDLLLERPGIARLVLADLSQNGGISIALENSTEIEKITQTEKQLFEEAVQAEDLEPTDFTPWYGSRLGMLYVTLSYEWLSNKTIPQSRADEIKKFLSFRSINGVV